MALAGCCAHVEQEGDDLLFTGIDERQKGALAYALGASDDYSHIKQLFSGDPTLAAAIELAGGLRIMRQPLFETVVSFIISQNNNIPRICGIVSRLCENYGERVPGGYAFPTAERLASLTEQDLAPLRSGFRARYILDASRRFALGELDPALIASLPLEEAAHKLMTITGVGPKVAACSLLFGAHRLDAFPIDVWIKRAMAHYYPSGLPEQFLPYAGIAQQYIFVYARTQHIE